jgi:hypothetical protein
MSATDEGFTAVAGASRVSGRPRRSRRPAPSFASDVVGGRIRNAVSGSYYRGRVGSADETRLWKVARTSQAKVDGEGNVIDEGFSTSLYFYDSPEQYETHRNCTLGPEVKAAWRGGERSPAAEFSDASTDVSYSDQ